MYIYYISECPPATGLVPTTDERPSVHQRATSFAQVAKLQNKGSCLTGKQDLIALCRAMTSFYRPRPASELPKLLHLSTTEPARKQVTKLQVQVPKRNLNCPKCGLTQLGKRLVGSRMKRLHITFYPAFFRSRARFSTLLAA